MERYYDYETNSYLKNFKTPEALSAMKRLHVDYYTNLEKNRGKPDSFIQEHKKNFLPRPKDLPKDFKSSFMSV